MICEDDQTDEGDMTKKSGDYQVNNPNGGVQMEMATPPIPNLTVTPENTETYKWTSFGSFCEFTTTFHGFRFLFNEPISAPRRIIWVVVLLLAISGFIALVALQIIKYTRHDIYTTMRLRDTARIKFPQVTICNNNKFRASGLHNLGVYDLVAKAHKTNKGRFEGDLHEQYYLARPWICDMYNISKATFQSNVTDISIQACQKLCSQEENRCSAVLYHLNDSWCLMTSFTGDLISEQSESDNGMCNENNVFYRKVRNPYQRNIRCNFEESCNGLKSRESRKLPITQGHDGSFKENSGHFLYLSSNIKSVKSDRISTDFTNTSGTCLMFQYANLGYQNGFLYIRVIAEDLSETNLQVLAVKPNESSRRQKWFQARVRLPDGIHRLSLEGSQTVYLGVDNIELDVCENQERGCRFTRTGTEYLGSQNFTKHGDACLPWNDARVIRFLPEELAPADVAEWGSQCRNPDGDGSGPWCVTIGLAKQECAIPFCACKPGWYRCHSGGCVPTDFLCNGVDDCGDRSDESHQECKPKTTLECDFEDEFMCGYMTDEDRSLVWRRFPSTKRSKGFSLQVSSSIGFEGNTGDVAVVTSPLHSFEKPTNVAFDYMFMVEENDHLSSFSIVMVDEYGIERLLLQSSASESRGQQSYAWLTRSVCVPRGRVRLRWRYTQGMFVHGASGIDNIRYSLGNCAPSNTTNDQVIYTETLDCSFDDGLCGHVGHSENTLYQWTRIPYDKVPVAASTPNYFGSCNGTIFDVSGYSTQYTDLLAIGNRTFHCIQTIEQPKGAGLTVHFDDFIGRKISVEYLAVYDGPSRSVYYGSRLSPPDFTSSARRVNIALTGNYTVKAERPPRYTGYLARFLSTAAKDTDYAIAASFKLLGAQKTMRSRLISPVFNLSKESCLTLDVLTLSSLEIKLVNSDSDLDKTTLLIQVHQSLGLHWHRMLLDMSPSGLSSESVHLEYLTTYTPSITPQYTAALNNIRLKSGSCTEQHTLTNGSVDCTFNEIEQCGYVDVSEGPTRWTRSHSQNKGFNMFIGFKDTHVVGRLLSPTVSVSEAVCLKFKARSEGDLLYVAVNTDSEPDILVYFDDNGEYEGFVRLPEGNYRIEFGAYGFLPVSELHAIELLHVQTEKKMCNTNGKASGEYRSRLVTKVAPTSTNDYIIKQQPANQEDFIADEQHAHEEELKELARRQGPYDVARVMQDSGQHLNDLLVKCKYGGMTCGTDSFEASLTLDGMCYVFNRNANQLINFETGKMQDLKLTLNAEVFDYVDMVDTFPGIKVSFTTQKNVGLVQTSGIPLQPGTHSVVTLGYREYNQGEEILTYNQCLERCWTQSSRQKCGCVLDASADQERCSLEQYLRCIEPALDAMRDESCECALEPRSTFTVSSFYTQPVPSNSWKSFDFEQKEKMEERLSHVANVLQRVKNESFSAGYSVFLDFIEAIDKLIQRVEAIQISEHLSADAKLQQALENMLTLILHDSEPLYGRIPSLTDAYDYFLKPNALSLLGVIDDVIEATLNGANTGRHKLYSSDGVSSSDGDSLIAEIEIKTNRARETLIVADDTYGVLTSGYVTPLLDPAMFKAEMDGILPSTRVAQPDQHVVCSQITRKLVKYCDDIQGASKRVGDGIRILEVLNNTNWQLKSEISDLFTQLGNLAANLSLERNVLDGCLKEYPTYLESLKRDSEAIVKFQESLTNPVLPTINTKALVIAKNKVASLKEMYLKHMVPFVNLGDIALASNIEELVEDVVNFVQFNIKDPTKQHVDQMIIRLAVEYRRLFKNMILFSKYFNSSDNLVILQRADVLRIPRIHLSTGNLILQKSTKDSFRTIPTDTEAYFTASGFYLLDVYLRTYADDLQLLTMDAYRDLDDLTQDLVSKAVKIKEYFSSFSGTVNEQFIRENLIQVDIKLDNMEYEKVVAQGSLYDLASLFGDIGGYMALLLGGSLISIVELLDWALCSIKTKRQKSKTTVA